LIFFLILKPGKYYRIFYRFFLNNSICEIFILSLIFPDFSQLNKPFCPKIRHHSCGSSTFGAQWATPVPRKHQSGPDRTWCDDMPENLGNLG
jgi:hypothetical protein